MTNDPKPDFATNRPGERVADAIIGFLKGLQEKLSVAPQVLIASAYFNPAGFELIADYLEKCSSVKLLLGAEPLRRDNHIRSLKSSLSPTRASTERLKSALTDHEETISVDRDLLGFTFEADCSARRLVKWLDSGKVEVRRLESSFLHGKAFIVTTYDEGIIAGSSNFTYAGLATNVELNLGNYEPHVVRKAGEWFNELWDEAVEFDLSAIYKSRYVEHSPYLIFLRMLFERYGAELEEERGTTGVSTIQLTTFQRDGLWRAQRILGDYHGVIIADEVGLGKTYLAGELIRKAVEENRQRVLLIAPATLRDGPWARFFSNQQLGVEKISFEELSDDKKLNPEATGNHLANDPKEYSMIVIDEAHALRNPSTLRANALRQLLSGSPPKKVVLITATPVNNSLWDLYWLLTYFIRNDAVFADSGIKSIKDHFAVAMAMNPDDLSPEHLFDILDAIAVRRTREFVKTHYRNDTVVIDGDRVPIVFPTPRVRKVIYNLDEVLPGFFDRFAHALDGTAVGPGDPTVLSLARYSPSQYRLDNNFEPHEIQLAGLLRSGLLKRFESSAHAFARTCRKMVANHDAFLTLLDQGKIGKGEVLADWIATDADDEEEINEFFSANAEALDSASDYDTELLKANAASDRDLLLNFAEVAENVSPDTDPKLAQLIEELAEIASKAKSEGIGEEDERDKRKVIIFSYFADTVEWITNYILEKVSSDPRLAVYNDRVASISGVEGSKHEVLWGFAPRTTEAPGGSDENKYDIVVATDVLAEGVNLQQARHIINYDLPWNPMRLVQRHGRIDRIGSNHKEVFLRCVFPDAQLDDLLGLEERLHRKIAQAAAAVGVAEILPGSQANEINLADSREEIERLRREDATLFEKGGSGRSSLSGEEYRQELKTALLRNDIGESIRHLPWGSGSGMSINSNDTKQGYVFCARIADHPRPVFRYISSSNTGQSPISDTLTCIDIARPRNGFETPRLLDDDTANGAYSAWTRAVDDIVEKWNEAADPANLAPSIPLAMHRAAELVREHRPIEMTIEASEKLIDALQAPYPERIVRLIRSVLSTNAVPEEIVRLIEKTVSDLGLEPTPPPTPLPEITSEDVHLICWIALV
jgi:superfamily II DNA or RNA helicase